MTWIGSPTEDRPSSKDLLRLLEPRAIRPSRTRLGSNSRVRATRTGQGAWSTTSLETEPRSSDAMVPWPREPTITRSARKSRASSMIASATRPRSTLPSTDRSEESRRSRTSRIVSVAYAVMDSSTSGASSGATIPRPRDRRHDRFKHADNTQDRVAGPVDRRGKPHGFSRAGRTVIGEQDTHQLLPPGLECDSMPRRRRTHRATDHRACWGGKLRRRRGIDRGSFARTGEMS